MLKFLKVITSENRREIRNEADIVMLYADKGNGACAFPIPGRPDAYACYASPDEGPEITSTLWIQDFDVELEFPIVWVEDVKTIEEADAILQEIAENMEAGLEKYKFEK